MSTRGERLAALMDKAENKEKNTIYLSQKTGKTSQYISKLKTDNIKTADPNALKIIAEELGSSYEWLEFGVEGEKILYTEPGIFNHLPIDLQDFVLHEENTPYLVVAKQLKKYDLSKMTVSDMEFLISALQMHIQKHEQK
jgi:hypothetical protein